MNERQADQRSAGDEGFTLIEVMVAILVFAIVSTGIVAGMTTIISMTGDNRARITAANLASQELDTVRAIADPYSIQSVPVRDIQVGDTADPSSFRTFHLERSVSWISSAGTDVSCNSSTNLFFLRVNVRVTWDGMLGTTSAVQDDTVLAPSDGSTTASTGAIAVTVDDSSGAPLPGVVVTVTPYSGGEALTSQPKNTTADGCTYANDVKPGTYTVKLSKAGYIGQDEQPATSKQVVVSAGATTSVPRFSFEKAGTFTTAYVAGPVAYTGSVAKPSNLPTNFYNSNILAVGGTATTGVYTTATPASTVSLYPFSNGYSADAGPAGDSSAGCSSIDPQAWVAGIVNGVALAQGVRPTAAAAPGGAARLDIPVGVVLVRASSGAVLTATQATPTGTGNPGCDLTGTTLTYAATGTGGWTAVGVPYGSWTIKADGTVVGAADLQVKTNTALLGVSADGTVTLDPRKAR